MRSLQWCLRACCRARLAHSRLPESVQAVAVQDDPAAAAHGPARAGAAEAGHRRYGPQLSPKSNKQSTLLALVLVVATSPAVHLRRPHVQSFLLPCSCHRLLAHRAHVPACLRARFAHRRRHRGPRRAQERARALCGAARSAGEQPCLAACCQPFVAASCSANSQSWLLPHPLSSLAVFSRATLQSSLLPADTSSVALFVGEENRGGHERDRSGFGLAGYCRAALAVRDDWHAPSRLLRLWPYDRCAASLRVSLRAIVLRPKSQPFEIAGLGLIPLWLCEPPLCRASARVVGPAAAADRAVAAGRARRALLLDALAGALFEPCRVLL